MGKHKTGLKPFVATFTITGRAITFFDAKDVDDARRIAREKGFV